MEIVSQMKEYRPTCLIIFILAIKKKSNSFLYIDKILVINLLIKKSISTISASEYFFGVLYILSILIYPGKKE